MNGWPLFCARAFLLWVNFLPESLDVGERITTAQSWPVWREQALRGSLKDLHFKLANISSVVRYPAEGMAFVFAPICQPDDDEPAATAKPNQRYVKVVTLLIEADEWRVHVVGSMISPASIAKIAYSW